MTQVSEPREAPWLWSQEGGSEGQEEVEMMEVEVGVGETEDAPLGGERSPRQN